MKDQTVATIDEYIAAFPPEVQQLLQQIRQTIQKAAPEAKEKIGYGIPTFTLHGNLVHFAGYEHHLGFYPGSAPIVAFKDELSPYKTAKGTIQFPLDQPLPLHLITRIVQFCIERNLKKSR